MVSITEIFATWQSSGIFTYVLPFFLVFGIIFAILEKTKVFGESKKEINAIISIASALLMLQIDAVPQFFSNIFPKLGIALAALLVVLIFVGFFDSDTKENMKNKWIGIVFAGIIILWAVVSSIPNWSQYEGLINWLQGEWLTSFIPILILIVIFVIGITKSGQSGKSGKP